MSFIKDSIEHAKLNASKLKKIVIQTIQRQTSGIRLKIPFPCFILKMTISKVRSSGEGRNIRALEAATGLRSWVDDTPEGYCNLQLRSYTKRNMQIVFATPGLMVVSIQRIEIGSQSQKQLEEQIREIGERTIIELVMAWIPIGLDGRPYAIQIFLWSKLIKALYQEQPTSVLRCCRA